MPLRSLAFAMAFLLASTLQAQDEAAAPPAPRHVTIVLPPPQPPPPAPVAQPYPAMPGAPSTTYMPGTTGVMGATGQKPQRMPSKALFWEVRGSDFHPSKSHVFLLGSIHVANESFYPLTSIVENAFQKAPVLVVEVNERPEERQHDAMYIQHAGTYPEGSEYSLRHVVSTDTYDAVSEAASDLGMSLMRLSYMKPWMAAFTIERDEVSMAGLDPALGIDLHFLNEARGKKEIVALESVEEQIDMFDSLPKDQQEALLYYTAKECKRFHSEMERVMKLWRYGDAMGLAALIDEGERESPELKPAMDTILVNRNKSMADKIETFFESDENHFVVIGAAHLVGPTGIVALLQAKGYFVEQK